MAEITIHAATWDRGGLPQRGRDHYTSTGWPILDQHAALADRIHAIDPTRPDPADLADLASWVQNTVSIGGPLRGSSGRNGLLTQHGSLAPRSIDRLTTALEAARTRAPVDPALTYLADTIARHQQQHTDSRDCRASVAR